MSRAISNRYDFTFFFDVRNGNPNGDPDAGNMPRIDPETGIGLVTDVSLKRKVRNYVELVHDGKPGYEIYVKEGVPLNRSDLRGADAVGVRDEMAKLHQKNSQTKEIVKKLKAKDSEIDRKIRDAMCEIFYDVRTFGAVMTTYVKAAMNCGQTRGPIQLEFAESVEPVVPRDITLTRVTITTEADAEEKRTEIGNKSIIPYGLYRCNGYISAALAERDTGFSEEDLKVFWEALLNMFEHDRSAARAQMTMRKLYIFKHDSKLGNAPAHRLLERINVQRKESDERLPARSFEDYVIQIEGESSLPEGVELIVREQ